MLGKAISCPANGSIAATPEIWGITFEACQATCGMDQIIQTVDFSAASVPLTTWLLPWLALVAQLPFEADGWMDLLSACLCVGSPVLAAYSLALTAFNRSHISHEFRRLKRAAETDTRQEYRYMVDRVEAASFILQEAQQCPVRANQRTGELGSLIALNDPHRRNFWTLAAKDLKNTRRSFTYSFAAQVFLAFVTYLISFIAAVVESLGSPDIGLQFASSTVWSWMFPIVFGYIYVGSQSKAGSITEALTGNMMVPGPERDASADHETQSFLPPEARIEPDRALPPPTWWGWDVRGDERQEGGIFNYARVLTWFALVEHVGAAFQTSIENFQAQAAIPLTAADAAERCGLKPREDLVAFTAWSKLPTLAIRNMGKAALVALFLQWDTTGAAVFVAYYTPAVGIGCRSGSYLIYGVAATLSWLLLIVSHLTSHALMQRLEKDLHRGGVEKDPHRAGVEFLGGLAVLTRFTGKAVAIANTGWLIASSVLEDIGTFQTCWCQTDAYQYHRNGWTPVFKGSADLRDTAPGIWIGGFLWSLAVCVITAVVFAYGRRTRL
ncbi:hypothetical protein DFH09DRAFT_1031678 [Mycena vulgaris]|nr:hypothetical protein DFH09DRAFT_1031678 [Mycena vulgaris]